MASNGNGPQFPSGSLPTIVALATEVLERCNRITDECRALDVAPPTSLASGASSALWSDCPSQLDEDRRGVVSLATQLITLVQGPHDYIHEFVASNWDHGALYVFLQARGLEHIAAAGPTGASLPDLSDATAIPEDKLVRILALLRCKNFIDQRADGMYVLNAISDDLHKDADFRAWVEFQLFETRVASAHLSDALSSKPNGYADGKSAFKQGWDLEMYDWHVKYPDKGQRFREAMRGVSKALDPADSLIRRWFAKSAVSPGGKIVELGGRYGFASVTLVDALPAQTFEVRSDSDEFLQRGAALVGSSSRPRIAFTQVATFFDNIPDDDLHSVDVYLIRNLFWNWSDADAIRLIQFLLPTLRASASTRVLITDGVSPDPGEFEKDVELAFRRRDVTTMTMHNVKQRTQAEWLKMFKQADSNLEVTTETMFSSHVYKGLWEISIPSVGS